MSIPVLCTGQLANDLDQEKKKPVQQTACLAHIYQHPATVKLSASFPLHHSDSNVQCVLLLHAACYGCLSAMAVECDKIGTCETEK